MGSDRLDCGEDRLYGGDAAQVGEASRTRAWHACRPDERGADPDQGLGTGSARAAPSQRDPAQGLGLFCDGGARPPLQAMIAFIDDHRPVYGAAPTPRPPGAVARAPRPPRAGLGPGPPRPAAPPAFDPRVAPPAADPRPP